VQWCKIILNVLEAIYLRLRTIVVQRITVAAIKFGVWTIESATDWFRINGVQGYENSRTYRKCMQYSSTSDHLITDKLSRALRVGRDR